MCLVQQQVYLSHRRLLPIGKENLVSQYAKTRNLYFHNIVVVQELAWRFKHTDSGGCAGKHSCVGRNCCACTFELSWMIRPNDATVGPCW